MIRNFTLTAIIVSFLLPCVSIASEKPQEKQPEKNQETKNLTLREILRKTTELPYPQDGGGTQFHPTSPSRANGNHGYGPMTPHEVGN